MVRAVQLGLWTEEQDGPAEAGIQVVMPVATLYIPMYGRPHQQRRPFRGACTEAQIAFAVCGVFKPAVAAGELKQGYRLLGFPLTGKAVMNASTQTEIGIGNFPIAEFLGTLEHAARHIAGKSCRTGISPQFKRICGKTSLPKDNCALKNA